MKRNYESYLEKALDAYAVGFSSKAAQKDAVDFLSSCYRFVRDEHNDEVRNSIWDAISHIEDEEARWEASRPLWAEVKEIPFDLYQVREAKHADIFGERWEKVAKLVELRAAFKAAPVVPKARSEAAILIEEERAASKAIKDDGFRIDGYVTTQFWHCVSHLGNAFYRCNWYTQEGLVSYQAVQDYVGSRLKVWEAAGKPNMKDWSYDAIREFYQGA